MSVLILKADLMHYPNVRHTISQVQF